MRVAKYGLDFRAASPEAALARSTTPVLLIHGLDDRLTPPEHSEILGGQQSPLRPSCGWCREQGTPARSAPRL